MQKWKQDSIAFIGESVVHLALGSSTLDGCPTANLLIRIVLLVLTAESVHIRCDCWEGKVYALRVEG